MVWPHSQCNWDMAMFQLVGPVNDSPSPPPHASVPQGTPRDRPFGMGLGCVGQSQNLAARSTGYAYISVAQTHTHTEKNRS